MNRSTIMKWAFPLGYCIWLLFGNTSCKHDYGTKPPEDMTNIPQVTNTVDVFEIALRAEDCTRAWSLTLRLGAGGVVYFISVSDYKGGGGEIAFRARSGMSVILDTLGVNQFTSYGVGPLFPPEVVEINLRNLSATVLCRLRPADGTTFPLSLDDFPTRVGTQWRYARVDSARNFHDTVEVTVIGKVLHARGGLAGRWEAKSSADLPANSLQEVYSVTSADTTHIYWEDQPNAGEMLRFFRPMVVGQVIPLLGSEGMTLAGIDSISLPAGLFAQAYHLIMQPRPDDPECWGMVREYWVQPRVGIVRLHVELNGSCSSIAAIGKQWWDLISFRPGG